MMAMAMAQTPCSEFTIICIDNAERAICNPPIYQAQLKGARYYCETVLQCTPDSMVSIFTMSSKNFGELVPPTNDLQELLDALKFVPCNLNAETEFDAALCWSFSTFSTAPPKMKKRLLMFVGHTIDLHLWEARLHGTKLKESSVALDVFNFRLLTLSHDEATILQGKYHYGRTELERLVTEANANGNSHIVDIVDEYESSVLGSLSKSILKKHLRYLKKIAAADDEKNSQSAEAEEDTIKLGKRTMERCNTLKNSSADKKKKS